MPSRGTRKYLNAHVLVRPPQSASESITFSPLRIVLLGVRGIYGWKPGKDFGGKGKVGQGKGPVFSHRARASHHPEEGEPKTFESFLATRPVLSTLAAFLRNTRLLVCGAYTSSEIPRLELSALSLEKNS